MLQSIRRKLFWILDTLKGGKIRSHYIDISSVMANPYSVESNNRRFKYLDELLNHAVKSTSFYSKMSDSNDLEDFMVIDKNIIRQHYKDFQSSLYTDKNNYCVYTSGSTGTPFKLLQDKNKRIRHTADVIFFAEQAGFKIGQKLYYIRHWDKFNGLNPLVARVKNVYMHSVSNLSKSDLTILFRNMSKGTSSKGLMCYASVLDEMKNYLEKQNPNTKVKNVKSVIAISESLKVDSKASIENYFGVPVVSRYSNVENGIIAQQLLDSSDFEINWASYYIELLEIDSNSPVEYGALGRIVVTDLFNYCMPMIRYDTGDVGIFSVTENNGVKRVTLKRVEGRKMDMIFNTKGEMKSPFMVYHLMKYPHIIQYQFIQEAKTEYRIKLNVLPEFHSAAEIIAEFKNHLGNEAIINLQYVDDIPLLSSGKRKFVINHYKRADGEG